VHGVFDAADGDRGPSFLRGGFSSARYVPPACAERGLSANDTEARHQMSAPVARMARASDQDKKLAVREHRHARPEAAQQVPCQRLLGVGVAPTAAPSRLPVSDSAATHRACGTPHPGSIYPIWRGAAVVGDAVSSSRRAAARQGHLAVPSLRRVDR
jgi:hypothetical protein